MINGGPLKERDYRVINKFYLKSFIKKEGLPKKETQKTPFYRKGRFLILAETKINHMSNFISLETAKAMTTLYRKNRDNILKTEMQNQNVLAICETFDKNQLETLLSKSECASLRIYYGMDNGLNIHAIIVAVNGNNEDILPAMASFVVDDGDIIDNGIRCPELCPPPSPLNS